MKKKILIILFSILLLGSLFAEGLDKYGSAMKNQIPNAYTVIKEAAEAKWPGNYTMIVFEINQQSKAVVSVMDTIIAFIKTTNGKTITVIESKEFNVFKTAISKWSYPEMLRFNMSILDNWIYGGDIIPVYAMYTNWVMVEFDYLNQIKASNSY